jgi:hypothetical protein
MPGNAGVLTDEWRQQPSEHNPFGILAVCIAHIPTMLSMNDPADVCEPGRKYPIEPSPVACVNDVRFQIPERRGEFPQESERVARWLVKFDYGGSRRKQARSLSRGRQAQHDVFKSFVGMPDQGRNAFFHAACSKGMENVNDAYFAHGLRVCTPAVRNGSGEFQATLKIPPAPL